MKTRLLIESCESLQLSRKDCKRLAQVGIIYYCRSCKVYHTAVNKTVNDAVDYLKQKESL
jgi:hypothetical protein